jgi:hypothetical protein
MRSSKNDAARVPRLRHAAEHQRILRKQHSKDAQHVRVLRLHSAVEEALQRRHLVCTSMR